MSVPNGFSSPFFSLDQHIHDKVLAHRAAVFAALSQHSDPALREIGRLLAGGTVSPHQLLDDPRHAETLRRIARKLNELDPEELRQRILGPSAEHDTGRNGAPRQNEAGPASQSDHTDPDNGAGGVPAIRR
jgi:hypothetical protein